MRSFVLWFAVIVLCAVGVIAAIGRTIYVDDLAQRAESVRVRLLHSLRQDHPVVHDPKEASDFDKSLAAHPVITLLHVIPGGLFLLLAPFQFSRRIRQRHIRVHRWLGRVLMIAALITGSAGLYFGLLMPYAGFSEGLVIALVGALLFVAVIKGFVAIRRGQIETHRRWMIRAFAVAIGISTVRFVVVGLDIAGVQPGGSARPAFAFALWTGWAITLAAAELWIRSPLDITATLTPESRKGW